MKILVKHLLLIAALSFFASCTPSRKIQSNMNLKKHSIAYIMDSGISKSKTDFIVGIDPVYFNPQIMLDSILVKREKALFLPLVFVNIWRSQNLCILGRSIIEEDISSFFSTSLIDEINRSGNFNPGSGNNTHYRLEVSIDEITTEGPYSSSGFFYFALVAYGYAQQETAGPAISHIKVSYYLKSGDETVYSNDFVSGKMSQPISRNHTDKLMLQRDYAISMVEAQSQNIKNAIEHIVQDVNTFLADL